MKIFSKKLMFAEISIGIFFLIYEFFTGQGVPWTMEDNFHFNIALGFFVGAGYTFILAAFIGSISNRSTQPVVQPIEPSLKENINAPIE